MFEKLSEVIADEVSKACQEGVDRLTEKLLRGADGEKPTGVLSTEQKRIPGAGTGIEAMEAAEVIKKYCAERSRKASSIASVDLPECMVRRSNCIFSYRQAPSGYGKCRLASITGRYLDEFDIPANWDLKGEESCTE